MHAKSVFEQPALLYKFKPLFFITNIWDELSREKIIPRTKLIRLTTSFHNVIAMEISKCICVKEVPWPQAFSKH